MRGGRRASSFGQSNVTEPGAAASAKGHCRRDKQDGEDQDGQRQALSEVVLWVLKKTEWTRWRGVGTAIAVDESGS